MSFPKNNQFKYSWEEAIEILRKSPKYQDLIFDSYLTEDVISNCKRFFASAEFDSVSTLLKKYAPGNRILDMPSGNGIASYALARSGFDVVAVDPNPSLSVGRGAVERVLTEAGLKAEIVDAYGEDLPFHRESFDAVYVRQGLHHANNLPQMLKEISRILRPGGVLLACREHVVDNYDESLQDFLDSQVDHQLYGGENAFTLADYRSAIISSGLFIKLELDPYDSVINLAPSSLDHLKKKILNSMYGRVLRILLPDHLVTRLGLWHARRHPLPGRLFSFLAIKPIA